MPVCFRDMASRSGGALPGHGRSASANVTPTSTPSPKKRQLPQIPAAAQQASRDRGNYPDGNYILRST